jgi:hypothetical protein
MLTLKLENHPPKRKKDDQCNKINSFLFNFSYTIAVFLNAILAAGRNNLMFKPTLAMTSCIKLTHLEHTLMCLKARLT